MASHRISTFGVKPPVFRGPILWLGAASFEPRCVGSAQVLRGKLPAAVIIDYATRIEPAVEGERRRAKYRAAIQACAVSWEVLRIGSYQFGSIFGVLNELHARPCDPDTELVIDVTCITKIHAVAVALWLVSQTRFRVVHLAYSRPSEYRTTRRHVWGKGKWVETVVAPFDFAASHDGRGVRGLFLLGHEGDRLRLAADALSAESGVAVVAKASRQELRIASEAQNAWFLRTAERRGVKTVALDFFAVEKMLLIARELALEAVADSARIVLYPLGPKPLVLGAALALASVARHFAWYSYPIPLAYDLNVTGGWAETRWASVRPSATT